MFTLAYTHHKIQFENDILLMMLVHLLYLNSLSTLSNLKQASVCNQSTRNWVRRKIFQIIREWVGGEY